MTTPSPRARPDISMSHDEMAMFLATQSRAVVVALDGTAPVGTVADVAFSDDVLSVALHADDPIADLIARDDRVCVMTEQFPTYYEIKGVSAHGRAAPLDSEDGRVRFTLGLDDTTSFDFGKVPRQGPGSGKADPA